MTLPQRRPFPQGLNACKRINKVPVTVAALYIYSIWSASRSAGGIENRRAVLSCGRRRPGPYQAPGAAAAPSRARAPPRCLLCDRKRSCCLDISIFISFIYFILMSFREYFLCSRRGCQLLTPLCCPCLLAWPGGRPPGPSFCLFSPTCRPSVSPSSHLSPPACSLPALGVPPSLQIRVWALPILTPLEFPALMGDSSQGSLPPRGSTWESGQVCSIRPATGEEQARFEPLALHHRH